MSADAIARWGGEHQVSAPTLYHVPGTISSPIAQVLIELEIHSISVKTLTFAELKQQTHLAINPMGSSPAFSDGDAVRIWESLAVLGHVLEMYDTEHRLHPPARSARRIDYLHLQAFIVTTVYPFVASLFLHTLKPANEQDASYVEAGKTRWAQTLGPTLVERLGRKPFLLGDEMSAVDFLLAKPLRNADSLGVLAQFPTLDALYRRISTRPSFAQAYNISAD